MTRFFRSVMMGFLLVSVHAQAVGNPEFAPDVANPEMGIVTINNIITHGRVSRQNVELAVDFGTGACEVKQSTAVDADTVTPQMTAIDGGVKIVDEWLSSGGQNTKSFKNHHFLFDMKQAGEVNITIRSSVYNYLYLIDSLGLVVARANGNTITTTLEAGQYKLVAATYYPHKASSYELSLKGAMSNIKKINSTRIERTGQWTSSGGQSTGSYRNEHYLFDVKVDSYINVSIKSNVSNYLYLINSLGFVVATANGNHLASAVPADSYRLVAATYYPAKASNYTLTIVGQFDDFKKKTSNSIKTIGSWSSSGGQSRTSDRNPSYSFDVTEDGVVDFTIKSSVSNVLYLVDSLGNLVASVRGNRLKASVSTGRYKLVAATYYKDKKSNFVLNTYGQIENFVQN